jgi:hypothetical protein
MPSDPDIVETLQSLREAFPRVAAECFEAVFAEEAETTEAWEATPRLQVRSEHCFSLGSGNESYQAIAVAGFGEAGLDAFADETLSRGDVIDAFRELLNTYCGMLMDEPAFVEHFGILTQSLPQYTYKSLFVPRADGMQGALRVRGGEIVMGYAIRKSRIF